MPSGARYVVRVALMKTTSLVLAESRYGKYSTAARVLGVDSSALYGDANLFAVLKFAMAMETMWAEHDAKGIPMACTIGRFHTDTESHGLTIVPGSFHLSLDVRAYDEAVLAELDL